MKKTYNEKKSFSIIELIFAIMIIGIIASVAIPKLFNLNTTATISAIKQDTSSIISSVQSYYILNKKIDKISDSINLNSSIWDISDTSVKFMENEKNCIDISILGNTLVVKINSTVGKICEELEIQGINSTIYILN
ncbi:MAG TPA: prepilin-type cleavage/methylation domain-containing protein [Arcobacter sp.]|nr:prepilin-type cleavage/methylation domain-containing protein [Arcobacter sp.]